MNDLICLVIGINLIEIVD